MTAWKEPEATELIQEALLSRKLYPGPIDGKAGPKTLESFAEYVRARLVPTASSSPVSVVSGRYSEVFKPAAAGNFSPRKNECKGIILHHSCGTVAGDISWIQNPKSGVSYHVQIAPNGARTKFVPYDQIAYHAGKSSFKGREFCNPFMLGLAFTGDTNTRPLTTEEMESAWEWIALRVKEFGIKPDWITTHRAVSPGRKDDISAAAEAQFIKAKP